MTDVKAVTATVMVAKAAEGFAPEQIRVSAEDGIHVVVGPNNSGKTRLIRHFCSVETQFEFNHTFVPPHRRPNDPVRDVIPPHLRDYAGEVVVRWDREGKHKHAAPATPEGGQIAKALLEQGSRVRKAAFLGSSRLFSAIGPIGAKTSPVPPLDGVVPWYFAEQHSIDPRHQEIAERVGAAFSEITGGLGFICVTEEAEVRGFIQEGKSRRLLSASGEGLQDLFFLVANTLGLPDMDLFIDEPGLRLHPSMQRSLLRFLSANAGSRSIWLATHDGVFIGDECVRSHVRVHRDGGVSQVENLEDAKQRHAAVVSLGWIPSDAVLADRVLLCEGLSDEIAFGRIATELMGHTAMVRQLGGANVVFAAGNQLRDTLQVARQAAPYVRFSALLDSDGRETKEWDAVQDRFTAEKIPVSRLSWVDLEACWIEAGLSYDILREAADVGAVRQGEPIEIPSREEIECQLVTLLPDANGANRLEKLHSLHNLVFNKPRAATTAIDRIDPNGQVWKKLVEEVRSAIVSELAS